MEAGNVSVMSEDFDGMTFPECFAFIERSRRQVRMLMRDPHAGDTDKEALASIFLELNAMEQRLRAHANCP